MISRRRKLRKMGISALFVLFLTAGHVYAQTPNIDLWLDYAKKGMYDKAIAELNKLIVTFPDSADAYYNRGTLYAQQKEYDEAIADFNKALGLNPKYADAYYNRSVTFFAKKEYENAWADVHMAEKLGYNVKSEFLEMLKKASGREK